MFELVCARNRLLRLDHVGFGMSDRDLKRYDFDVMADDVAKAADAAGIERFSLFSESGGVHVALRFIAKYPDRVVRLAILGGYVDGRARREGAHQSDFLRAMLEEGNEGTEANLIRAFSLAYFSDGPIEEANAHARIYQASFDKRERLLARDAINFVSSAHLLSQVPCPTLIVHGRSDPVHPLSEARKLASGIPKAELLILETANHLPLPGHETWHPFAKTFRAFLDR